MVVKATLFGCGYASLGDSYQRSKPATHPKAPKSASPARRLGTHDSLLNARHFNGVYYRRDADRRSSIGRQRVRRIHFFPKGGSWLASSRYRVFHLAEELEKIARPCKLHSPPRILRRYLTQQRGRRLTLTELAMFRSREVARSIVSFLHIPRGEIIFAQRSVYSRSFATMLLRAHRSRPLIFDIDDAVQEGQRELTRQLVCKADMVIVGSHALELFAHSQGSRRVYFFPTSIPLSNYSLRPNPLTGHRPTIGWMGTGPEHLENIKILRLPLIELAKKFEFLFLFVGSLDDPALMELLAAFEGVRMEIIPNLDWANPSAVLHVLHRFDIGLMPLTDTPRHRAKCAFKAIESMACAIPVVVSGIGENVHLVESGQDGFPASTEAEWIDRLSILLGDEKLRRRMGAHARTTIEKHYDIQKNAGAFNNYLALEIG